MTTPHEVPNTLTLLTIPELLNAWLVNWELLGVNPTRAAVELKVAHVKLETGLKFCHNWNLGNLKHADGDGANWCCFACGEEVKLLPNGELPQALQSPRVTRKGKPYLRSGAMWQSVWIVPPHPWTRFKAFDTLIDGVRGQTGYLKSHPKVLAALMTGDALEYCEALHNARYFTADPNQYVLGVRNCLKDVHTVGNGFDWGDVP